MSRLTLHPCLLCLCVCARVCVRVCQGFHSNHALTARFNIMCVCVCVCVRARVSPKRFNS